MSDAGPGGRDGNDAPAGETASDAVTGDSGGAEGGQQGLAFVENGGQVVMEAESSTGSAAGTGTAAGASWTSVTPPDTSGTALTVTPNVNLNAFDMTIGPRRDYAVRFTAPGTYYVWVRMIGATTADDSVHAGLGGTAATLPNGLAPGTPSPTWVWANVANGGRLTVNVAAAGTAVLNLWMREDGVQVDRLLLTTAAAFTPAGIGPAESARQ